MTIGSFSLASDPARLASGERHQAVFAAPASSLTRFVFPRPAQALAAGEAPPPPPTAEGGAGEGADGEGGAAEDYGQPLEKPEDWNDEEDGPWEAPENPGKKSGAHPARRPGGFP